MVRFELKSLRHRTLFYTMGVFTNIAASSALGSLILTRRLPEYAPFASTIATFSVVFFAHALVVAFWNVLLYPYLFSPLRHLPEPKVGATDQLPCVASLNVDREELFSWVIFLKF